MTAAAATTARPGTLAPLIRARGLELAYGTGGPVIRGLDLEIGEGEFVVVAGASGSGKSTLLGALCGLVPHTTGGTLAGELTVGPCDLRTDGPDAFGRLCGWVGQDPEAQLVLGTPRGEIALGPQLRGQAPGAVARAVEEAALALHVHTLLDRQPRTLSGGEQQRVAIAAALAQHPRVLVLDEPTSQLDPVGGEELISLLRRLHEEWGMTVVLAEHRLERCLSAATRVIALDEGRIAFDGAPADFCAWSAIDAPALATGVSRLLAPHGLASAAVTVRDARAALASHELLPPEPGLGGDVARLPPEQAAGARPDGATARPGLRSRLFGRSTGADPAVAVRGGWRELRDGAVLLRGVDLEVEPGEAVALMGRNGAGKSTLLRALAGLDELERGKVERAGRIALLLQRPADHLLHERVADELWDGVDLAAAGLDRVPGLLARHPSALSGGERQRLAALVVAGRQRPAVLCLDEPTRGLDRAARALLATQLAALRAQGTATIVATHDPEFAAEIADRVVLLAGGEVLADAPAREVLAGGWAFATEVARVLRGAGGAITLEQGTALLAPPPPVEGAESPDPAC
ncbi:MAG: ATP-binding cassette domain-containing protein [Solirubrobacteraceae bacterium]|nr:ATP-binding cassette domain-containing protein [Solirubrobacteraceae bacterium]